MIHPKGNKYESTYLPYQTRSLEALLVLAYASHLSLCSSRALPSNQKCLCGDTEHHLWSFLWTPQFGTVLCAAEKTSLLALLGGFLFLDCNRKYFVWDLFSSTTTELWCSFVVVDLLYQLKELSKHTLFVNLANGKKEKRTNPTSQDAKKMTSIFSLVHFQTCKHLC